jgi:hypothetical protein
VSNIGAPVAYSAWNLPPSKAFISFVSNPPAGDSGLGLRVRPSPEEVEALVVSLGEILLRGRKRKRDVFGECHAWIRMPALLLLLPGKCQCQFLLKPNPMGVTWLMLTPMGVALMMLTPMGVTRLMLTPMGVLSVLLARMRKRRRKSP